ncbi:phage minor capsid protein [bacterium 210820-DFI.6.52]|nr:phage minor capsid protein [bacterium 210820-DFI.6.52]
MVGYKGIADWLAEMELKLIASLSRNLQAHKEWEKKEGFDWPAWQAVKLHNLDAYRKEAAGIANHYSGVIDPATSALLRDQFQEGYDRETEEITQLLGEGRWPHLLHYPEEPEEPLPDETPESGFFGINRPRMEALVKDTQEIESKAVSAALRMTDDVYRTTINKAAMMHATGGLTAQQAIDLAIKDFLAVGINCIQYANGRRVNIASYAEMAIRTAATRSYLQGAAQRRMELGIDTVLVSQYGACSETCLPWQGRVYIDDVFAVFTGEIQGDRGKSRRGGWYPLLSVAIANGLFHPNCRHTLTAWVEGSSTMPAPLDAERVKETAKLEQKQRRLENKIKRWKRLAAGSKDPVNVKQYKAKVREAQAELREHIAAHPGQLRRDYWKEKTHGVPALENLPVEGTIEKYKAGEIGESPFERVGLDPQAAEKTVQEMENALDEFPQLRGQIRGFGADISRGYMATRPDDDLERVVIHFNPRRYSDAERLKRQYARDLQAHYTPQGTTWEQAGVHELGHVALARIISRRYATLAEMEDDWNRDISARQIIRQAWEELGGGPKIKEAVKAISEYAAAAPSEAIGEAILDCHANGEKAQPISQKIKEVLKRWLL